MSIFGLRRVKPNERIVTADVLTWADIPNGSVSARARRNNWSPVKIAESVHTETLAAIKRVAVRLNNTKPENVKCERCDEKLMDTQDVRIRINGDGTLSHLVC